MAQGRIPRDNEEMLVFLRQFSDALKEKGRDDKFLTDGGTDLGTQVEEFIKLDELAKDYDAKKKQTNEKKYILKDDMLEQAARLISYLEFKLGKTSKELEDYIIKPRK